MCDAPTILEFKEQLAAFEMEFGGQPATRAGWFTLGEHPEHGWSRFYLRARKLEIVTAMFDLAIQRARDGERSEVLAIDPVGGRPFVILNDNDGYLIQSEFDGFDGPVRLHVGQKD
jgi:hypothetical protein